ncbi:MAG: hypothetical protein B7X11_01775 [Acidobacteria bacterium 37-65-4]|nr:MAG: hypothetical protein B7X11_01775 [Acidobacteria bacterium 37-65-4]
MITHGRALPVILLVLILALTGLPQASQGKRRPSIVLRANPAVAFAPARIVVTAELSGGANDYQDFYCAKVEWSWGDDTTSESQDDCDPYEAGKTEIRRRYTNEHRFELPGHYDVRFTLKQGKTSVGSGTVPVRIRDAEARR